MLTCCYCDEEAQGNYSVHQFGINDGPELDLCNDCGSTTNPTLEEIWAVTSLFTADDILIKEIIE